MQAYSDPLDGSELAEAGMAQAGHTPYESIAMAGHGRGGLGRSAASSMADRSFKTVTMPIRIVSPQE